MAMSKTAARPAPDKTDTPSPAESPEGVASSWTAPHDKAWSGRHPINIRVTIPIWGFGTYYATFLAGKERRGGERLKEERARHPLMTHANMLFLFIVGFIVGGAVWILLRALALWALGSNDV